MMQNVSLHVDEIPKANLIKKLIKRRIQPLELQQRRRTIDLAESCTFCSERVHRSTWNLCFDQVGQYVPKLLIGLLMIWLFRKAQQKSICRLTRVKVSILSATWLRLVHTFSKISGRSLRFKAEVPLNMIAGYIEPHLCDFGSLLDYQDAFSPIFLCEVAPLPAQKSLKHKDFRKLTTENIFTHDMVCNESGYMYIWINIVHLIG